MLLTLALARDTSTGRGTATLDGGLVAVVPLAQRLEVSERVVISAGDVVALVRGLAAQSADGVARLAAVAISSQDVRTAPSPVTR